MVRASDNGAMFAAILNLPPRSCLRLDGQTILLHRDDFVGIGGIPLDGLHLLTVRPSIRTSKTTNEPAFASISTGFILPATQKEDEALVRKYDPQTEEVSDEPVDEMTRSNLVQQIHHQSMDPQRMIPYASVIRSEGAALAWRQSTSFVTLDLLTSRGIPPGTKIIPGAQDDQMADFMNSTLRDGVSPKYPMIPVLDAGTRRITHRGTKAFLQSLSPNQRTALLTDKQPSSKVFRMVLQETYKGNWRDLLGDIQLSYILFLNLQCYSSLEHWRDTVALSCRVSNVQDYSAFYKSLVQILSSQIQSMESDLFDDVEMSAENFLVPSLQRLWKNLLSSDDDSLVKAAREFGKLLQDRLPHHFENPPPSLRDRQTDRMMIDVETNENHQESADEEEEDEDGPVVVAMEEIEAAQKRQVTTPPRGVIQQYSVELRSRFPILFAAQQPHEDIVMTCARALEAATDVSLVREAAEYLEQVEARKAGDE